MKDRRIGGHSSLTGSREWCEKQKTSYEDLPCKITVEPQKCKEVLNHSSAPESRDGRGTQRRMQLLEVILSNSNIAKAYKRVVSNKGKPGIDGMTVDEIGPYLHDNWKGIKEDIIEGRFKFSPVRRVEIPKANGGVRLLGIPIVLDRIIQQAIAQILIEIFDPEFSSSSYGFRPKRSQHDAIKVARKYINEGYNWVVDIDLENYFNTVNHDILMGLIAKRVGDKRVLKLIRQCLKSGVMINGVVSITDEGCPQGSPLSPMLSNIMLDVLDKELEKRGHKFCRFADDQNIYVRSKRAAERVMSGVTRLLEERLKLKVNKEKSAIDRPWNRKFLGFTFYVSKREGTVKVKIHEKSIKKFREKIKQILSRSNGWSMTKRLEKLNQATVGWINYFRLSEIKSTIEHLEGWIRRRLRMCIWKQWKKIGKRAKSLIKLGVSDETAWRLSNSRKGCWSISGCTIVQRAISNKKLEQRGFKSLTKVYLGKT